MRIEYEITLDDAEAWYRHYVTLPEVVRTLRKRGLNNAGGVSLVIFVLSFTTSQDLLVSLVPATVMFFAVWAMIGSAFRHETIRNGKKALEADPTNAALGPHTLEITPQAMTEICPHHTLSVHWDVVRSIVTTEQHVFILLNNLTAFIVPQRAFSSESARQEFVQQVQGFIPSPALLEKSRGG